MLTQTTILNHYSKPLFRMFQIGMVMIYFSNFAWAQDPKPTLLTKTDSVSYAVGVVLGQNLKRDGIVDLNYTILKRSINDVNTGDTLLFDFETAGKLLSTRIKAQKDKAAFENEIKSVKFLLDNKKKEGIKTTSSGLQYKIKEEGVGDAPSLESKVKLLFTGKFIDGTVFDSVGLVNPVEIGVNEVIPAWREALLLMKKGAKWTLYVPASLAFGEKGSNKIPANTVTIFELELLEILP